MARSADLLARFAEEPSRAAVFLDVDGVLAPIVPRPEDAQVPEKTRAELRRLNDRYGLVACISGRTGEDARNIVGVSELMYVGNHGLELEPGSELWRERLHRFLSHTDWRDLEDKGLTATLHYRNATDERAARASLEAIAERAREAGLIARFGRKVLEIVPPLEADKGTAIRRLLAQHELVRALFVGDDTTDIDGFLALDGLEVAVRVAVASDEGPAALRDAADIVIDANDVPALLRRL